MQCLAAVDFGDISNLPAELQTALRNRFPNLTSNSDAAVRYDNVGDDLTKMCIKL